MASAKIKYHLRFVIFIILIPFSLLVLECSSKKDKKEAKLIGDWEHTNPKFSDKYPTVNVFLPGVSIDKDSLAFFSDYMSNPIFNYRKYTISSDSITIEFDREQETFALKQSNDTLYFVNSNYVYKYIKLYPENHNDGNQIEFNSINPGMGEKRYFFDLSLNRNGTFRYVSKSEDRQLEGVLKEKYTNFIFDKLNKIELPIKYNTQEEIITHDHVFTMELFKNGAKLDSLIYSKEVEGAYAKWLASILQSAPLWIDDAIIKEK